jgi:2-C-methyl-D-erythritol 4-phosphate cytidylyltransferase
MTQSSNSSDALWIVIPAAGAGRRIPNSLPKQYLRIAGRSVLEWTVEIFLRRDDVAGVVVVVAPEDGEWQKVSVASHARVSKTIGGAERAHSVLNGLLALDGRAQSRDWVLVHDAARPCLADSDLQLLIDALRDDEVGGILATPLSDTLKESDADGRVKRTLPREQLWRALTPQMFRFDVLRRALQRAINADEAITDEASAVEALGLRVRLIKGRADNLKITLAEDLDLAQAILERRSRL